MRAETPGFDIGMRGPRLRREVIEQALAFLGRRGRGETGAHALMRVRGKRELRHQQQAAAHVAQTQVHLALCVAKYTVTQQALEQAIGFGLAVAALGADEHHQAGPDCADAGSVDLHSGLRNALQQPDHRAISPYRRVSDSAPAGR